MLLNSKRSTVSANLNWNITELASFILRGYEIITLKFQQEAQKKFFLPPLSNELYYLQGNIPTCSNPNPPVQCLASVAMSYFLLYLFFSYRLFFTFSSSSLEKEYK